MKNEFPQKTEKLRKKKVLVLQKCFKTWEDLPQMVSCDPFGEGVCVYIYIYVYVYVYIHIHTGCLLGLGIRFKIGFLIQVNFMHIVYLD